MIFLRRAFETLWANKMQKERQREIAHAVSRNFLHGSKARIFQLWQQISKASVLSSKRSNSCVPYT